MKRFLPHYSFITILLFTGCAAENSVTVRNEIRLRCSPVLVARPGDEENSYQGLKHFETGRFFCTEGSTGIHRKILEAGTAEAVRGGLFEAEIIFLELKDKEKNGAVENNLAVIYELNGDNTGAFTMYSAALLLDPENILFRKNFYYFLSDRGIEPMPDQKRNGNRDAQR